MNSDELAIRCRDAMWKNDHATHGMDMSMEVSGPGQSVASFVVTRNMINGHGLCHGGYIFALADSAFAFACNGYNRVTVASGAAIEFVRAAALGDTLTAVAREVHRGGRTGVYDVIVTNQDDALVATFRGRSYATREPLVETDT